MKEITVLFVDDELSVLSSLERSLIKEPYNKKFANSGKEALDIMTAEPVHVIVSDMKMPEMDGLTLLQRVKEKYPDTVRLVLSGFTQVAQIIPAINTGEIYRYVTKPLEPDDFRKTVRDAIDFFLLNLDRQELVKKLKARNHALEKALKERLRAEKALKKARNLAMEVESRIEKTLLRGQLPDRLDGAKIAALGISAKHLGGDFFEVIDFTPSCFDLMLGDVMGKGVNAALIGAGTKQSFLRALGQGRGSDENNIITPTSLAQQVHAQIAQRLMKLESFVTLSYTRFDLDKQVLTFVDCGHLPILHYQKESGKCIFLKGSNSPLGFTNNEKFSEDSVCFNSGDIFILCSDGITEAASPDGEMFGQDGLARFIEANSNSDPDDLLHKLRDKISDFTNSTVMQDDFTCVAIKICDS